MYRNILNCPVFSISLYRVLLKSGQLILKEWECSLNLEQIHHPTLKFVHLSIGRKTKLFCKFRKFVSYLIAKQNN